MEHVFISYLTSRSNECIVSWTHASQTFPNAGHRNHCGTADVCEDGMWKVFCLKQMRLWLLQIFL